MISGCVSGDGGPPQVLRMKISLRFRDRDACTMVLFSGLKKDVPVQGEPIVEGLE